MDKHINCNNCIHYYITWDKSFPYGCRAVGFKSKEMPSITVRANSGMECLQFKLKMRQRKKDIAEPDESQEP